MKIPLGWLKEHVDVTVEPQKLGDDLTAAGIALDGLERDGREVIFDFDITTNRVDCMNVHGLAREVAVLYGLPLRPLELDFAETGPPAAEALSVVIEAADLCLRFTARVLDARPGQSPQWLKDRLEQVGVRPINGLVDLSNYVMMEMGQPSHAFDLDQIPGHRLIVRWARPGEQLVTLDGQKRELDARTGVMACPEGALGLAGVMGGQSSEVSERTRVVALEAACWEPLAIRRAARRLGLRSEASHRFERGCDFDGGAVANARIAHLLTSLGLGTVRPGLIDVIARRRDRAEIPLRAARVPALLGADVPAAEVERLLRGLGFGVERVAGGWHVQAPGWRNDVTREIDLLEELARQRGLAAFPNALPPAAGAGFLSPLQKAERLVRRTLTGAGLDEAVNYAFAASGGSRRESVPALEPRGLPPLSGSAPEPPVDDPMLLPQGAIRLANPLSEEQGLLRSSLVLPGLLRNLQTNLRQGRREVRVFELGRVFLPGQPKPLEEPRLGILLAGPWQPHWSAKARAADVYDLLGLVEALLQRFGRSGALTLEHEALPSHLHPGRGARLLLDGQAWGCAGELAPELAQSLDLRDRTLVAELTLDALIGTGAPVRVAPLPRFPAVERDLSLLLDAGVAARELEARVRSAAGPLLRRVSFVDRYDRPPVPAGQVSLTLSLRFQHAERTLTAEEAQAATEQVIAALRGAGVEIRGV